MRLARSIAAEASRRIGHGEAVLVEGASLLSWQARHHCSPGERCPKCRYVEVTELSVPAPRYLRVLREER